MKVNFQPYLGRMSMKDVATGECFILSFGEDTPEVFMKTTETHTDSRMVDAISLNSGEFYCFGTEVCVYVVDAELTVK